MAGKLSSAKTAATRTDGSAVLTDDNSKAMREAEAVQLVSYVGKIQAQNKLVAVKKAEMDALRAIATELYRGAKAAGFLRKELDALLADMGRNPRDLVEAEQRRRRFREVFDMPNGETALDLFGDEHTPDEVKDEAYQRAAGYLAGCRGDNCEVPPEVPPRFVKAWIDGHGDGQAVIGGKFAKPAKKDKPKPVAAEPLNVNRAEASGWKIFELEGDPATYELETPEGVTLADEYASRELAWAAAEAFMDAPVSDVAPVGDSEAIH